MRRIGLLAMGVGLALGCASAATEAGAQSGGAQEQGRALVPAGFGTLRQDEITVQLRIGELLIKATPLDEGTIRLAAPDTYGRLHALAESRRTEAVAQANGEAPELFLVSFFSYQPDVSFQPEDLQITYQGRILRAAAILPVTTGFGRQRLAQQESQSAIYAFDIPIDYGQPFVVRYGFEQAGAWAQILPKLEVERGRIMARTKGQARRAPRIPDQYFSSS